MESDEKSNDRVFVDEILAYHDVSLRSKFEEESRETDNEELLSRKQFFYKKRKRLVLPIHHT